MKAFHSDGSGNADQFGSEVIADEAENIVKRGSRNGLTITTWQQWYGLSDQGLEGALSDSIAMRAFAGIDPAKHECTISH